MHNAINIDLESFKSRILSNKGLSWDFSSIKNTEETEIFSLIPFSEIGIKWTLVELKDNAARGEIELFFKEKCKSANEQDLLAYFILLNAIDCTDYDWKNKIIEYYILAIPPTMLSKILLIFITDINTRLYLNETNVNQNPITIKDYDLVIRQLEHCYRLHSSPLGCFYYIIKYSQSDSYSVTLGGLNKVSFCLLISVGTFSNLLWLKQVNINKAIQKGIIESLRVAVILSHMPDTDIAKSDINILQSLCINYWEDIGNTILCRAFLNWKKRRDTYHITQYEDAIRATVRVFEESGQFDFIKTFMWPECFTAYAGYLMYSNVGDDGKTNIPDKITDEFARRVLNQWGNRSIDSEVLKYNSPYDLYEPLEAQNYFLICITGYFLFKSTLSEERVHYFRNTLFHLKPMLYSSYSVASRAREQISFMIMLCLSMTNIDPFTPEIGNSLSIVLDLISNTVLYPYIAACEMLDEIWDVEHDKQGRQWSIGTAILFQINVLLARIRKTESQEIKLAYTKFIEYWTTFSSTRWPWMREDWGIME